jgi:hypothetical protein
MIGRANDGSHYKLRLKKCQGQGKINKFTGILLLLTRN